MKSKKDKAPKRVPVLIRTSAEVMDYFDKVAARMGFGVSRSFVVDRLMRAVMDSDDEIRKYAAESPNMPDVLARGFGSVLGERVLKLGILEDLIDRSELAKIERSEAERREWILKADSPANKSGGGQ